MLVATNDSPSNSWSKVNSAHWVDVHNKDGVTEATEGDALKVSKLYTIL